MRARNLAIALVTAASVGLLANACASIPDPGRYTVIGLPDYKSFADNTQGVHLFLEKQCGTLDCHGQVGRPFRLYSSTGLRLPNDGGAYPGNAIPTTTDEIYANYLSLVGLEPEETSRVTAGQDPPTFLLVVAKPAGFESHKGGIRMAVGQDMYLCLTNWLAGLTGQFEMSCMTAAAVP